VRDKGVVDLAAAFERVCASCPGAVLVFVGPDEEGIAPAVLAAAGAAAMAVRLVNYTDRPEDYLAGADLVCVPSYREGFCTVVVEAAASGVPALASRIYGTEDGLVDGVTGEYLPAGDSLVWATKIVALAADPARREQMGRAGRAYVMERFQVDRVVAEMRAFYARVLGP
jgi:glycosyltransferase involved in cell wall biosynthesis